MKFAGQAYRIPRELPLDVEDPLIDIRSAHALNVARNLGRPGAIDETHAAVSRFASWLTAQVQILSSLGSSLAKNHDKEKDPGFIPATPPAHLPAIDLLADLNGSGQAKEFGLKFHWFTSMPLVRLHSQAAKAVHCIDRRAGCGGIVHNHA